MEAGQEVHANETTAPIARTSTALSSSINLLNNVVGAGLFSMPWCLAQSTLISGCLVFIVICLLNLYSFVLLARCCQLAGCFSYLEIGNVALGPRFGTIAQGTSTLYACGSLVSYVVLAVNFLLGEGTGVLALLAEGHSSFLSHGGLAARVTIGCAFSALFFLPLSMLRSLDSLKLTSWLALLATLYAGYITLYELAASPPGSLTPAEAKAGRDAIRSSVVVGRFPPPLTLFAAVPIVNVAFTAHYNAPRYYQELERRSLRRYMLLTSAALSLSLAIYTVVAISGYLSFGSFSRGDVLENFADAFPLAVGARGALLVVLVSCFPKVQHSVRDGLLRLGSSTGHTTDTAPCRTLALCTTLVVGGSTLVGTLVERVETVLAYKGAIFGSLMVYILPAMMYTALIMQRAQSSGPLCDAEPALMSADGHNPPDASIIARKRTPVRARDAVVCMLTTGGHLGPALLFVWGVVTGVLGVAVTIDKQLVGTASLAHNP